MVTFYALLLLIGYLTRDKIVAGLLALQDVAHLAFVWLLILACGLVGQVPESLRADFEQLRNALQARVGFATSPVFLALVVAQVVVFQAMCHAHPSEFDSVFQVVLGLSLALIYLVVGVACSSAESALAIRAVPRPESRLPRAPRVGLPQLSLRVPSPPPRSLLRVA